MNRILGDVKGAITAKAGNLLNNPAPSRLGRVVFGDKTSKNLQSVSGGSFSMSGFTADDGDPIDARYKVTVTSKRLKHVVVAIKQDQTSFGTTSNWSSLIPNFLKPIVEAATQLGGASLQNRLTSRRIWTGTSPINMSLTLTFESIVDTFKNVMEPCIRLMQMSLPSGVKWGEHELVLRPPGPSPYSLAGTTAPGFLKEIVESIGLEDEKITVKFGNWLKFDSVIISEVNPTFDSRISIDGYPIKAVVDVKFQTYQIYTQEALWEAAGRYDVGYGANYNAGGGPAGHYPGGYSEMGGRGQIDSTLRSLDRT